MCKHDSGIDQTKVGQRKRWVYSCARGLGGKEVEWQGWNDEGDDDDCLWSS